MQAAVSLSPPDMGTINRQINYQAKLMNDSGAVIADGEYDMKFSLYNVSTGGTRLWTASGTVSVPTAIPVTVDNGLFTVMLGDSSAAGGWQNEFASTTMWNQVLYLGVTIEGDGEMSPRKAIGAVPQAFNAMQLQGMYASGTSPYSALFRVNRTDSDAASVPRSAFDVRSAGTSATNDYVARFLQPGSDESSYVSIRNYDGRMETKSTY